MVIGGDILNPTITDLWYGNIGPCERCGGHDSELDQLLSLIERTREELCGGLTEKQRETLDKYIACSDE